jgi:hypothetical protein
MPQYVPWIAQWPNSGEILHSYAMHRPNTALQDPQLDPGHHVQRVCIYIYIYIYIVKDRLLLSICMFIIMIRNHVQGSEISLTSRDFVFSILKAFVWRKFHVKETRLSQWKNFVLIGQYQFEHNFLFSSSYKHYVRTWNSWKVWKESDISRLLRAVIKSNEYIYIYIYVNFHKDISLFISFMIINSIGDLEILSPLPNVLAKDT